MLHRRIFVHRTGIVIVFISALLTEVRTLKQLRKEDQLCPLRCCPPYQAVCVGDVLFHAVRHIHLDRCNLDHRHGKTLSFLRNLLRQAVYVSAPKDKRPRRDRYHIPLRAKLPEKLRCKPVALLIFSAKSGDEDRSVRKIEIHIARRQTLSRFPDILPRFKVILRNLFLGIADRNPRDGKLMDPQFSSFCICNAGQILIIHDRKRILGIRLILRPGQHHFSRSEKCSDIIYMLIGLVIIYSSGQPEDLFHTQNLLQFLLDLFLREVRVSSLA